MPTVDPETVIGVRMPALRALAKELRGTPIAASFVEEMPHAYYEERNLYALLIEQSRYEDALAQVERFLPCIDNWATCDLLSPKAFAKNRSLLAPDIDRWLASDETYTIRFGIEMVMSHFLDADFDPVWLQKIAVIRSDEYYVNMMLAWFFATALAKQWDATVPYITEHALDRWVHNKTIQKAVESYRITPEQKEYLRTLKIKTRK